MPTAKSGFKAFDEFYSPSPECPARKGGDECKRSINPIFTTNLIDVIVGQTQIIEGGTL